MHQFDFLYQGSHHILMGKKHPTFCLKADGFLVPYFESSYEHSKKLTLSQTTNFRLFKIEKVCRRQFEKGRKFSKQEGNTVGKGEIAISNFFFSHSVFKRLKLQARKN